jgi:hypothetical protein
MLTMWDAVIVAGRCNWQSFNQKYFGDLSSFTAENCFFSFVLFGFVPFYPVHHTLSVSPYQTARSLMVPASMISYFESRPRQTTLRDSIHNLRSSSAMMPGLIPFLDHSISPSYPNPTHPQEGNPSPR